MKELYKACVSAMNRVLHLPGHIGKLTSYMLFALVFMATAANGQLTIKITASPSNTPFGESIYVGGTFNNWNPADPTKKLTALGNGKYTITIMPAPGVVEFKFCRGTWDKVEGMANGQPLSNNRKVNYNGLPKTVEYTIASWPDVLLNESNPNTITGQGVHTISDDFYIPELNRTRRITIYLPPDYGTRTDKYYPVMYMQDGQSLFQPTTAGGTEWGVDESLDNLSLVGDPGCIVVAIDNGGAHRVDEYSPWTNPAYGGGEGADYIHFIVNTLKPYIDDNYRTLSDRKHTGIGGSAMGGLISMYGLIEYQEVFSKAAIFSPSFWFVGNRMADFILSKGKEYDVRVYFLVGGQEPGAIAQGVELVAESMYTAGFDFSEVNVSTPSDGEHMEWCWSREFPLAYEWLFENDKASVATDEVEIDRPDNNEAASVASNLSVFPNPATDWVRINGNNLDGKVGITIADASGRVWLNALRNGNDLIETANLPRGVYALTVQRKNGKAETLRFIHE